MKVFTTGQVAKICKVHARTVSKWFDSGRLKGYRIPGTQDRRIPREYLIKFLKEHGMPLGELDDTCHKVLVVSDDSTLSASIEHCLSGDEFDVTVVDNSFTAGKTMQETYYHTIVIDMTISDALQTGRHLNGSKDFESVTVIAIVPNSGDDSGAQSFAKEVFVQPFDAQLFKERLDTYFAHQSQ